MNKMCKCGGEMFVQYPQNTKFFTAQCNKCRRRVKQRKRQPKTK